MGFIDEINVRQIVLQKEQSLSLSHIFKDEKMLSQY